jgi:hypothetical protein
VSSILLFVIAVPVLIFIGGMLFAQHGEIAAMKQVAHDLTTRRDDDPPNPR